MDEATRPRRQAVDASDGALDGESQRKSPEDLRREIEETRIELGDTVEALAEKADVKAQAQQRLSAVKDTASQKKDDLIAKARQAAPESAGVGAQQIAASAQQKPLPFAAGGALTVGLLFGWLLGKRQARS